MSLNTMLLAEMKNEANNTRKLLERVPMEKADWVPHEKSMPMGKLAVHVGSILNWVDRIMNNDEFDTAANPSPLPTASNQVELLAIHDDHVAKAISALENATDDDLNKVWRLRRGEHVMFELPRKVAIRSISMNHLYHHRGQLSVYLRLNDIPVPGLYGPSADDKIAAQ